METHFIEFKRLTFGKFSETLLASAATVEPIDPTQTFALDTLSADLRRPIPNGSAVLTITFNGTVRFPRMELCAVYTYRGDLTDDTQLRRIY